MKTKIVQHVPRIIFCVHFLVPVQRQMHKRRLPWLSLVLKWKFISKCPKNLMSIQTSPTASARYQGVHDWKAQTDRDHFLWIINISSEARWREGQQLRVFNSVNSPFIQFNLLYSMLYKTNVQHFILQYAERLQDKINVTPLHEHCCYIITQYHSTITRLE